MRRHHTSARAQAKALIARAFSPVFACVPQRGGAIGLGLMSMGRLGVDLFPDVEFPYVNVTATLDGASAETMESEVTDILEEYINTIDPAKSDPEIAWRYVQPSSEYRRLKVEVSSAVCRPSDVVLPCAKNRGIVFKFQRFEKIFQESCAAIFHSSSHFEYFNFQKILHFPLNIVILI